MYIERKVLPKFIRNAIKEYGWYKINYAGIVGSSLVTSRNQDIDIVVVTSITPKNPSILHLKNISLLVFTKEWLNYKKHLEQPTGIVPSILFKSLELSEPLIGDKNSLDFPIIRVCKEDWINVEIKKKRYENCDKKNYIIALLFEKLLASSPDLLQYSFDNIEMAYNLGEKQIAKKLLQIYNGEKHKNITDSIIIKRLK